MILTWQQVNGQETDGIVHASVKDHYKEKKEALQNSVDIFGENCTHWPYDCHDLKMTYCLLGKVNWNNEFGSNLLCGCPKRLGLTCWSSNQCRFHHRSSINKIQINTINNSLLQIIIFVFRIKEIREAT